MQPLFSIAVCTYKRPRFLADIFASFAAQADYEKSDLFEVLVIDNDLHKSALSVVNQYSDIVPFAVHYDVVDQPNISNVRNRAVDIAKGKYLVFLDDDQLVKPDFFKLLLSEWNTQESSVAAGVFQVRPQFDAPPPHWFEFDILMPMSRNKFAKDKYIHAYNCATNGVVIDLSILKQEGIRFNVEYGQTGGEDTELFLRLASKGYKFHYLKRIHVFERVTANRMDSKYLRQKSIRTGAAMFRVKSEVLTANTLIEQWFKSLVKAFLQSILMLFFIFNKKARIGTSCKMFENFSFCYSAIISTFFAKPKNQINKSYLSVKKPIETRL